MGIGDFLSCLVLATITSYFVYIGWYPHAVFTGLFFFLLVVNVGIHHLSQPLPRVILNAKLIDDPETIEKIKEVTGE